MRIEGYMVVADLNDETLTVDGTNKASRVALRGADHGAGPVVIARQEIAAVDLKKANSLTNGRLTVRTNSGQSYQLHFRKKSQEAFDALAEALA